MFPCVSLTSTDDLNHFEGSKKTQQLLRKSRTCPSNGQKKTYRPQTRINSDQISQFGLFSVVGWVWQHQEFTKRQEQTNLSLLKGKSLQDLGCAPRTLKNAIRTIGRWILTFENLLQNCRRKPKIFTQGFLPKSAFFEFFEANKLTFRDKNLRVAPASAELLQNSATHSPQKCKTDQILLECPNEAFFQNLPKIFEFLPFQKSWRQKWPKGFFSDRWQTRLPAQFPKEIGEMWQWFEMGNRWGGAGTNNAVDQERCKVCGWLTLLPRTMHNCPAAIQAKTQEPCKTEPAKHVSC